MSEAVGFESLFPIDIFINGLGAGLFIFVIYGVLYSIIKRKTEFSKPLILLGFISYIAYLYFSWSFCAPVFEIFSDADIFVVPPLNFVFYATLFLILLPVVAVVIFFFQSLG
ncbi:hypothetical protein [Methanosarcina sp. WH1]|uniref:hypothetical protein n=1 Tax=Methanosarcina sp. WH1 TaxID=1434102 RepID=UPI00064E5B61|nr:hypothetical protein [Methanosarcina sp. WH1]